MPNRSRWVASTLCAVAMLSCGGERVASTHDDLTEADLPDDSHLGDAETSKDDGSWSDGETEESPSPGVCNTLLAAHVLDLQRTLKPDFGGDCDAPLEDAVGRISPQHALCRVGESPNACRDRVYDTPPDRSEMKPGCLEDGVAPKGCLVGKWIPKCVDGTDDCSEPDAICQDGTRPMAWMEAGDAANNDWIFYMGGEGGPCAGVSCWASYRYAEEVEKTTAFPMAMSSHHPEYGVAATQKGSGITHGGSGPTLMSTFNRVRLNRCSDAASTASETIMLQTPDGTETGPSVVHHRGMQIWQALFNALATPKGRDLDDDGTPDMPSLADATSITLAGSSDASIWLIFAVDRLAEDLRSIAGPELQVRLIIDGYYEPTLDNELRYATDAPADYNVFDHAYLEGTACELPVGLDTACGRTCSNLMFQSGPWPDGRKTRRDNYEARGTYLDQSCRAFHGEDAWQCYDKLRVLFNHVSTPFFIIADQEDHTIGTSPVPFAEENCFAWATPTEYRRRVLDQSYDLRDLWTTDARAEGAGTPGDMALLLRKSRRNSQPWGQANHVHLGSNEKLQWKMTRCNTDGDVLAQVSAVEMMRAWIAGTLPATYVAEDGTVWNGSDDFWVTGDTCRPPQ